MKSMHEKLGIPIYYNIIGVTNFLYEKLGATNFLYKLYKAYIKTIDKILQYFFKDISKKKETLR